MAQHARQADSFKNQLRRSLERGTRNANVLQFPKHSNIYTCGDKSGHVYCIERGQVKLLVLSPGGKECLLSIYTPGDVFGEVCLAGKGRRRETAYAMEHTVVKQVPCDVFLACLHENDLLGDFVKYLATRISEQQSVIGNLVTIDSERRLGKTLLSLAKKLGKKDPRSIRIEKKITHEELSEMVGTTRPRVSAFMRKFRDLNLIEVSRHHYIIVKEKKLAEYLNRVA